MSRLVAIVVAFAALVGIPEALACRVLSKDQATVQMKQAQREWNAELATTRKVTGTYSVEREVPNQAQRDAVDEFGAIVGRGGRVIASTFLEQANMIVISCGPLAIKPRPGQTGTFFLRKRDGDERFDIVHFVVDGSKDD